MNKCYRIYLIMVLTIFLAGSIYAQKKAATVNGRVFDKETNEPLVAASVYFAETTIGTSVELDGTYSLTVVKPGNYELVVSMIGYETQMTSLVVEAGKSYSMEFKLVTKPMNINPVEIEGENQSEWRKNLRLFTRKIMGNLLSEEDCMIENKEYLDFKWSGDTLIATARKPVIVDNTYLGYKIIFEILKYKFNPVSTYQEYSIYSRFIEMPPENKNQKEKWDDNRKEMFYGSPVHFLWAVKHNRMKEEDFKVHFVSNPYSKKNDELQEVKSGENFKYSDQFLDEPLYSFNGYIKVEYKSQISYAKMRCAYFTLDSYGIADNHLPISTYGFWSNFGVASMLPRDYLPESLKNNTK